ncbi:MAG TPA: hypothetical protein VM681_01460 [Candidatus Thermoplasmatota archaeon]|nr:hypothetical protein [Candidatus Thermoplasmatota archaeon]
MEPAARAILLAALVTVVGIAGCLGSPAAEEPASEELGAHETPPTQPADDAVQAVADAAEGALASPPGAPEFPVLRQYGCTTTFGRFDAPMTWAQEQMPAGFAPRSGVTGDSAVFLVKTWTCARGTIGDRPVEGPAHAIYYLPVKAPSQYASANGNDYVLLGWIASDPEETAVYRAWNFPAETGEVSVSATRLAAAVAGKTRAVGGGSSIELDLASQSPTAFGDYMARYFGVSAGSVANAVDIFVGGGEQGSFGAAALSIAGPRQPFTTPVAGSASTQFWPAETMTYQWTYVPVRSG